MALPDLAATPTSGIYVIRNTATGGFYLGSSEQVRRRMRTHHQLLRIGKHVNAALQDEWNRRGESAFEFEVIADLQTDQLLATEQRLLDRLVGAPGCYNEKSVANAPMRGKRHAPGVAEEVSRRFRGKPKSPEHRARIAEALRGLERSPEHRANIAKANTGRRATEETRRRLSVAHKGRPCPMKGKRHSQETIEKMRISNKAAWERRKAQAT